MPEPAAPPLERILSRPERGPRSMVDVAMGVDRSRPPVSEPPMPPTPKGELNRRVTSCPVKVPRRDWEAVVCGTKRTFRTYADSWRHRHAPMFPVGEQFPRPVVIYSQTGHDKLYDARLAVVTAYRQEQLRDMTRADLVLEGFASMGHFRRYWKQRYSKWGYRPDDLISVVELRPWEEQDDEEQGAWLLRRLYGGLL